MTFLRKIGEARGSWDLRNGQLFCCPDNLAAYFTANGMAKPADNIKPDEPEPFSLDKFYEQRHQKKANLLEQAKGRKA